MIIKGLKKKGKEESTLGSMRFWIFILMLFIGIFASVVIRRGLVISFHEMSIKQRQADLMNNCAVVATHIADYNYLEDGRSDLVNGELQQLGSFYNGRIQVMDSSLKVITDTFNIDKDKINISPQIIGVYRNDKNYASYNAKHNMIELGIPIHQSQDKILRENNIDNNKNNDEKVIGALFASVSTDSIENSISLMNQKSYIMLFIVFILYGILAFVFSKLLVNPIDKIGQRLQKLADGEQIPQSVIPRFIELKKISKNFNIIFDRMRTLDESRQEFVSNVSHELKTPMASIKVLADSLMSDENTPLELYKEFMGDIAEEIDRENRIITELLTLVKLDKKASSLQLASVNINELIEKILKRVRPLADSKKVDILFESFRPITAEVDELKLDSAITNIVENAIKYNKEVGWVHVSINSDHKYCYIKISDNGRGISEEDLEHIFERFYRADKSHSREIGGTGLGLSITRSVILLHKGNISVNSKVGEGTSFDIRLPLNNNYDNN